jgi:hypothetical protein
VPGSLGCARPPCPTPARAAAAAPQESNSVPLPTAGARPLGAHGAAPAHQPAAEPAEPGASEEEWVLRLGTAGSTASIEGADDGDGGARAECLTREQLLRLLQPDAARSPQIGGRDDGGCGGGGGGGGDEAPAAPAGVPLDAPSDRMPLFTIRSSACGTAGGACDSAGALSGPERTETWLITEVRLFRAC